MPLIDLLPVERVRVGLAAADKPALIEALAGILAGDGDRAAVHKALEAREKLGSTGLGHGVAIPHGRSASFGDARAAFVRLAGPIDFGALDGEPVDLVAALIVPEHFTDQHLKLLAELAEVFSSADVARALRSAPDADALREVLIDARGGG